MFKKNLIAAFSIGLAIATASPAFTAMASTPVIQVEQNVPEVGASSPISQPYGEGSWEDTLETLYKEDGFEQSIEIDLNSDKKHDSWPMEVKEKGSTAFDTDDDIRDIGVTCNYENNDATITISKPGVYRINRTGGEEYSVHFVVTSNNVALVKSCNINNEESTTPLIQVKLPENASDDDSYRQFGLYDLGGTYNCPSAYIIDVTDSAEAVAVRIEGHFHSDITSAAGLVKGDHIDDLDIACVSYSNTEPFTDNIIDAKYADVRWNNYDYKRDEMLEDESILKTEKGGIYANSFAVHNAKMSITTTLNKDTKDAATWTVSDGVPESGNGYQLTEKGLDLYLREDLDPMDHIGISVKSHVSVGAGTKLTVDTNGTGKGVKVESGYLPKLLEHVVFDDNTGLPADGIVCDKIISQGKVTVNAAETAINARKSVEIYGDRSDLTLTGNRGIVCPAIELTSGLVDVTTTYQGIYTAGITPSNWSTLDSNYTHRNFEIETTTHELDSSILRGNVVLRSAENHAVYATSKFTVGGERDDKISIAGLVDVDKDNGKFIYVDGTLALGSSNAEDSIYLPDTHDEDMFYIYAENVVGAPVVFDDSDENGTTDKGRIHLRSNPKLKRIGGSELSTRDYKLYLYDEDSNTMDKVAFVMPSDHSVFEDDEMSYCIGKTNAKVYKVASTLYENEDNGDDNPGGDDDNNNDNPGGNNDNPGGDDKNNTPGGGNNNNNPGGNDNNDTPGGNNTPGEDDNNNNPGGEDDNNNNNPGNEDDNNNNNPGGEDNNNRPGDDDNNNTPSSNEDDDNNSSEDDNSSDDNNSSDDGNNSNEEDNDNNTTPSENEVPNEETPTVVVTPANDMSSPTSTYHETTGQDAPKGSVSSGNAAWTLTKDTDSFVAMKGKINIADHFEAAKAAANYDASAKTRYSSSAKKVATVDNKGNLKLKKSGEISVQMEQKLSGGWTSVGAPVKLYVQKPEMEKKVTASVGSSEKLSAFGFLAKTTYKPTAWKSSNDSVASVDADGNITLHKKGSAKIYADYGSGSMSSKKMYKTTLKVTE